MLGREWLNVGVAASCLRELWHFLFCRHSDGKARLPAVSSRLPCAAHALGGAVTFACILSTGGCMERGSLRCLGYSRELSHSIGRRGTSTLLLWLLSSSYGVSLNSRVFVLKPRRMPQRKPPFSPFLRGKRLGRWLHRSLFFRLMPLFEAVDNNRGLLGARRRIHGLREHSLPLQRRSWFKLLTIPVAWTQCTAEGATGVGLTETTGAQSRFIAARREPRVDGANALGATTNC